MIKEIQDPKVPKETKEIPDLQVRKVPRVIKEIQDPKVQKETKEIPEPQAHKAPKVQQPSPSEVSISS